MESIWRKKRRGSSDAWEWHLTFIGQRMGHNYYLYYLIDQVFMAKPCIGGIVELGTGNGALSVVLGLWGVKLSIPVFTVDIKAFFDSRLFDKLGITYIKADEFGEDFQPMILGLLEAHAPGKPVLFVCDGGNKKAEFNTWVPLLPAGSVICVHDWQREVLPDDIQETAEKFCVEFERDLWEKHYVQFAMFERRIIIEEDSWKV